MCYRNEREKLLYRSRNFSPVMADFFNLSKHDLTKFVILWLNQNKYNCLNFFAVKNEPVFQIIFSNFSELLYPKGNLYTSPDLGFPAPGAVGIFASLTRYTKLCVCNHKLYSKRSIF